MGQKLSCARPCIPVLLGTQQWLASAQTALLTSPSSCTPCIVTVLEIWIDLLYLCLHTPHGSQPCACGANSESCTQALFSSTLHQKGVKWQSLSSESNEAFMQEWLRIILKRESQRMETSLYHPPPPASPIGTHMYQSIGLELRIPDM
eukprot:scaffold69121_cov20-Tisochrysis_lutea.AAC.1